MHSRPCRQEERLGFWERHSQQSERRPEAFSLEVTTDWRIQKVDIGVWGRKKLKLLKTVFKIHASGENKMWN